MFVQLLLPWGRQSDNICTNILSCVDRCEPWPSQWIATGL